MKNKLTNTRVINSIGIGILAAITAGTPVLASLNDSLNDDNTAEPVTSSEVPVEAANVVTETQNAQIIDSLTEAQDAIQAARDELNTLQQGESGENLDDTREGNVPPAEETTSPVEGEVEGGETVEPSVPVESEGNNEEAGAEGETQPAPDEVQPAPDEAQPAPDEVQPGEEGQEPSTGEEPENPSVTPDEGNEGAEPGNTATEEGVQTPSEPETKPEETPAQTIDECLENSENAVGNIISDINKLDRENEKIKDAIADYNAVVENPNNFIGSIVDIVSNASSAVVDAVDSVAADEKIAQEQAQVAINAQVKGYASREEAEAARQQAQAAAIAAEEAYKSAQITVEEAAKNKTIADNNLAELERQRDQAAAALQEIDARIKDAQDMLRIILESNGFDAENINPDAFDPGQLAGDAKEAYINVMNALNQAQDEFNKAQDSYNTAVQNVTDAEINYSEAVGTLDNLNAELKKANEEAAKAADALDQEKYKEIITAYEEQSAEVGELQFDVEEAKKVLEKAENAVKQAQEIKNQADAVVEKAEEAVKAANGEDAKKIVESAEDAVKQNTKNIEEYLSLIKEAEAELEKTAGEAQIAVEKLQGLKEAATAAEENLKDRKADLEEAEKKHTDAKDELKAAEDELQAVLEERLSTEQMRVKKAQEAAKSGHTTEEHTLAIELIRYNLSMYDKGIDTVEIKKDAVRGWEITVSDSLGDKKVYRYSIDEDGMKVYQGTDLFYTESEFNKKVDADTEISQAKNNLNIKQNALIDAKKVFDDADVAFASATKEKEEADDKVQVLETLEAMAAALEKVHTQAEELVDAETSYREDCAQSADNLIEKLESLVSNKINYANASAKLSTVNNAKEAVENQIEKLTSLSVQQNVDKSAYNNLVAAYNEAKEDYDEAVEALEKCMAGRDHAETERNRARAAANAVFSYISGGTVTPTPPTQPDTNGSTTTPQPVDPMQPVYGTIIDTITSPVIGDTGASTGTNYTGYPGYTYTTWGGQTAYTADAPVASEEEPGEEDLVSVEDEAVPLAEVGEDSKNKSNNTTTTKTTRKVSDEKVPLADMETKNSKMSWWWILVIALLGATGTELYIRHKKKEEEEQKARRAKQNLVKI